MKRSDIPRRRGMILGTTIEGTNIFPRSGSNSIFLEATRAVKYRETPSSTRLLYPFPGKHSSPARQDNYTHTHTHTSFLSPRNNEYRVSTHDIRLRTKKKEIIPRFSFDRMIKANDQIWRSLGRLWIMDFVSPSFFFFFFKRWNMRNILFE